MRCLKSSWVGWGWGNGHKATPVSHQPTAAVPMASGGPFRGNRGRRGGRGGGWPSRGTPRLPTYASHRRGRKEGGGQWPWHAVCADRTRCRRRGPRTARSTNVRELDHILQNSRNPIRSRRHPDCPRLDASEKVLKLEKQVFVEPCRGAMCRRRRAVKDSRSSMPWRRRPSAGIPKSQPKAT